MNYLRMIMTWSIGSPDRRKRIPDPSLHGRLYEGHRYSSSSGGWNRGERDGLLIPSAIKPYYGDHPWGVNVFMRFRLKPAE